MIAMKQKSKRVVSAILVGLILISTVLGGAMTAFANGNGIGGSSIKITGGGSGNWGRNACGGGYLVSIVKYDKSLDGGEAAISVSDLDNAYKDSILVYNTKSGNDYVEGHHVTVSLGIRAGLESQGGGDLLDGSGNVVGEDGVDAYTVTAVKASSNEAISLLGFATSFGSGSNYVYDTDSLHSIYGQGGTFDFNSETDRGNWFSIVESIYGTGCTLGGVTRDAWVSNDAGENCVYCILIVPVALFANATSPNDATVVACYPASGVVNKTSIINPCQIQWGSFGEVGSALDTIVGYDMNETIACFQGYVPYGMWGGRAKVGANIAAYLDETSFNTNLSDVKYTIVAASKPDEIASPATEINNTTLSGVKYLYGDAGTDRLIDPTVEKTAKSVTGVSNVDDYTLAEASVFTVNTNNTVLYGERDDALNKILGGVSSRLSTVYTPSLVSGLVSAGNYYKLKISIDNTKSYKTFTSAFQKYMVSFPNYGSAQKVGSKALSGSVSQEDISANYLTNALYNSGDFARINSTDSEDTIQSSEETKLGVSVQLYKKTKTVNSHLKAYDVKVDNDGNFVSTTEAGTYTSEAYSYMDYVDMSYKSSIGSIADTKNKMLKKVYYFLVPNNTAYGYDNNFSPAIQSASYEDWSVVLSGDESSSANRFSEVTPSVGVTSEYEGYTVYVVRVYTESEVASKINVKSTLELQDYELSHVYQSIYSDENVKTSNFSSKKAGSTLGHTWFSGYSDIGVAQYRDCSYKTYVDDFKRYIWQTLSKVSGTTSIVSKNDNVGAWQTVIKKYSKEMLQPTNVSTLILSNEKKVDENVLLTRDIGDGDSLVASSISLQSAQEVDDFISDVLKMTSDNKPASVVKGDKVRDSQYTLSTAKDLFKFKGGWVSSYNDTYSRAYGVKDKICAESNLHAHINAKLVKKAYKTLYAGSILANVANVKITEITHKYVTDAMTAGTNTDKLLDDYNVVAPDSKNVNGVLTQAYALPVVKNNYRYVQDPLTNAWVESVNPITNNFYGEVQMVAQVPNIGDSLTSVTQYNVWVMSEKLRSVQASSLYFITAGSGDEMAINQKKTNL